MLGGKPKEMLKDRFKFIAASALGAGAVLIATGTAGAHLIASHGSAATLGAQPAGLDVRGRV